MQKDLSELLERIELCGQKCEVLHVLINQLAGESISIWQTTLGQPNSGQIIAKLLAHPSVSIRQEVGMIVNEQRAILDALACKLADRNGANHTNDVYFPITKTKAGFYEKRSKDKIRKLSDADRATIEALKPWFPSDVDPEDGNPLLFQLHEADRVRKHQNLLKWACLGAVSPVGTGQFGALCKNQVMFSEVGKEEVLAWFIDATCNLAVRFQVVYVGPTAIDGHAVGWLLRAFNDKVAETVRSFA